MVDLPIFLLIPVFVLIAAAYSSVGLGGGTAYLSVLVLFDVNPDNIRPIAWFLNCLVSSITFYNYYRQKHFDLGRSWPYLLGGLSGGAVGATLPISTLVFKILLGITLAGVGVRMLTAKRKAELDSSRPPLFAFSFALGLAVGVLSGLVGIGGGIILGPIIIAIGWLKTKNTAALTSLYILVTSAGALAGHFVNGGQIDLGSIGLLAATVVVGGLLGSYWGAVKASPKTLRRIFGTLAIVVASKLFIGMIW